MFHERVHTEGYTAGRAVRAVRGMRVSSRRLGIAGVADIVEFSQEDSTARLICPVEYKVGKPKVEDWDRLQVCAQALCLEEMFDCSIRVGALFYGETRRRERFELDEPLRLRVEELAERMRGLFEIGRTPLAEKGPKCRRCSLADICLPEALGRDVDAYWSGRS
ncbi:CRISPR-associated protein Cas4 [Eggerthella lenta]|nr:CRISPR-associated protein Cas4 [Eggerthella lenta]